VRRGNPYTKRVPSGYHKELAGRSIREQAQHKIMSSYATTQAREEAYDDPTANRRSVGSVPEQTDSSSTLTSTDADRTVRGSVLDPDVDVEQGGLDQPLERESKDVVSHSKGLSEKKNKNKNTGEVELDPNECRFEGEDDPDDPLNLPAFKKWLAVFVVGTGAICV
jgi:hypothetical protein